MPRFNDQVCGDQYTNAATISEVYKSNGGSFVIDGQDAFLELQYGIQGQTYWTDEVHVPVGNGQFDPGTIGCRFRNYVAGQVATVTAVLASEVEPAFALGNPGQVTVTPGKINGVTGSVSAAGVIESGSGFTVTHPSTGNYTVTFTPPLSGTPIVLVSGLDVNDIFYTAKSNTGFSVVTAAPTGTPADSEWNFAAIISQ